MINFPVFNPTRSASENNRNKKGGAVKASKETAKVAAQMPVTTTERRRDPAHKRDKDPFAQRDTNAHPDPERHKAKYIDIEV